VRSFLGYFLRFAAIVIGYVLASAAAGLLFTVVEFTHAILIGCAMFTGCGETAHPSFGPPSVFFGYWMLMTVVIGTVTFLPAIALIILAEFKKARDWRVYALVGAVAVLGAINVAIVVFEVFPDTPGGIRHATLAACGLAGGLVYWAVAGRKSGSWVTGDA
jgi:hypothetical protein